MTGARKPSQQAACRAATNSRIGSARNMARLVAAIRDRVLVGGRKSGCCQSTTAGDLSAFSPPARIAAAVVERNDDDLVVGDPVEQRVGESLQQGTSRLAMDNPEPLRVATTTSSVRTRSSNNSSPRPTRCRPYHPTADSTSSAAAGRKTTLIPRARESGRERSARGSP